MLLALGATVADGSTRKALEEILGADAGEAAALTGRLLADPHPLVGCAVGLWEREGKASQAFRAWREGMPPQVETGIVPSQVALDRWAERHTMGIITGFPGGEVPPWVVILMASALATKVTWQKPFDIVSPAELGATSRWAKQAQRVLRTPQHSSHRQFIADTQRAGRVAVHVAAAQGGLAVFSVIASEEAPAVDVIAAASQIAVGGVGRALASGYSVCSLFDLPLGEAPRWVIHEEPIETTNPQGREEWCKAAILPAWSAESDLDLADPVLGFPQVANAMQEALGLSNAPFGARQLSKARYSATGFYAASLTGFRVGAAMQPTPRPGLRRTAQLRFGYPFAVVAVSQAPPGGVSRWYDLPVFSAWITQPGEPDEPADT
jgi:hypothetical protein